MTKPFVCLFLFVSLTSFAQTTRTIWFDDLPIQTFSEGLRPVQAKRNYSNDTLRINGKAYLRGLGGQSPCILPFTVNGKAKHFHALIAADDLGNKDIPLSFFVLGDGKVLFEKKDMRMGDQPVPVDVDLTGVRQLGLLVTDPVGGIANKRTYCNWIDARIEMLGDAVPDYVLHQEKPYILTPPPAKTPKINSAKLFGATPGNPVLYTIAASGQRPMTFTATGLPKGLTLDPKTGIISGRVAGKGAYPVKLSAKNALGSATQSLTIHIGETIAMTPPIGWNGWNSWEAHIDQEKVIASADAMVKTGLRDHGWVYINIDDAWQGKRGGPMNALLPNAKFPKFKEMVDYIHSLGLKAGLYSTPYIASYGGYPGASSDSAHGGETHETIMVNRRAFNHIGKFRFEENDARQMAEWGFDFLKYDWRIDVNSTERMANALRASGRDVVFSLSNNAPFEKVADWARLSNMYRSGPDIKDSWTSLYFTSFTLDKWGPTTGHGHWADPDMMIVGKVSIGPVMHDTRLTPDEQYSHISIFSLLSAPMLIGCPLEQLDAFTLNLLTNDEVIAINQDPLGKAARLVNEVDGVQIWVKPLEDGSVAVGLFNIANFGKTPASFFNWGAEKPVSFRFDLAGAGLQKTYTLRDVWRQKDLGTFTGSFTTDIPYHGVRFLRLTPKR